MPNKTIGHAWLEELLTIREYQSFLDEGKLIVGVASVECVVSHNYPIFLVSCKNTVGGCWFLQILPCILPLVELV